jgi:hypothetical protein
VTAHKNSFVLVTGQNSLGVTVVPSPELSTVDVRDSCFSTALRRVPSTFFDFYLFWSKIMKRIIDASVLCRQGT